MKTPERTLLLLLTIIPGVFVLGIVGYIRWSDIKGTFFTNMSSLSTTQGTITSSSTYFQDSSRGGAYYYNIVYQFSVDGEIYSSNQVTFGPTGSTSGDIAVQYTNKYPIGAKVIVYYDPSDPTFSVLEPKVRSYDFLGLIGLLLFFPLVAVLLIKSNSTQNRHEKKRHAKLK